MEAVRRLDLHVGRAGDQIGGLQQDRIPDDVRAAIRDCQDFRVWAGITGKMESNMSRRKEPAIPNELLDQLLVGGAASAAFEQEGLLDSLRKALTERALNAELDHHLAGEGGAGTAVLSLGFKRAEAAPSFLPTWNIGNSFGRHQGTLGTS